MRFVTYRTVETEPRLGLLHDGLVIDVEYFGDAIGQDLPSTMLDFIDLGPIGLRFLKEAIAGATAADLVGTLQRLVDALCQFRGGIRRIE